MTAFVIDPIRIVLADDHPLFREGVAHSLISQSGIEVIGQAESGEEALRMATELAPDVVLLDVFMPGMTGVDTAARITAECPGTRIIMLTVSEDKEVLLGALKAGAHGYLLKGVSARELIRVVRAVASGEVFVSPALATALLVDLTRGTSPDPLLELTERERQVLVLLGDGLTNREIGEQLFLAEKTVKHYVTNILQKLQVRSRVEAALFAAKHRPE